MAARWNRRVSSLTGLPPSAIVMPSDSRLKAWSSCAINTSRRLTAHARISCSTARQTARRHITTANPSKAFVTLSHPVSGLNSSDIVELLSVSDCCLKGFSQHFVSASLTGKANAKEYHIQLFGCAFVCSTSRGQIRILRGRQIRNVGTHDTSVWNPHTWASVGKRRRRLIFQTIRLGRGDRKRRKH
jgi:hypothetical protein